MGLHIGRNGRRLSENDVRKFLERLKNKRGSGVDNRVITRVMEELPKTLREWTLSLSTTAKMQKVTEELGVNRQGIEKAEKFEAHIQQMYDLLAEMSKDIDNHIEYLKEQQSIMLQEYHQLLDENRRQNA